MTKFLRKALNRVQSSVCLSHDVCETLVIQAIYGALHVRFAGTFIGLLRLRPTSAELDPSRVCETLRFQVIETYMYMLARITSAQLGENTVVKSCSVSSMRACRNITVRDA